MIWLLATAFLSLGLINLDFSRGWWRGQLRRLAVGVPVIGLFAYAELPPIVAGRLILVVDGPLTSPRRGFALKLSSPLV